MNALGFSADLSGASMEAWRKQSAHGYITISAHDTTKHGRYRAVSPGVPAASLRWWGAISRRELLVPCAWTVQR